MHKVDQSTCLALERKVFSSEYQAKAEHNRINPVSTPVVKNATLTIGSNVTGNRVYVDGNLKGSTRLDLDLPQGSHTIRIEKDGYETYEETINLTDNLIIRGNLEKVVEQTTSVDKSALDLEFWQSIKESNDPDMFRAYLKNYPTGSFVDLAKLKIKKLGGGTTVASSIPDLDYGDYYALVIGKDDGGSCRADVVCLMDSTQATVQRVGAMVF